ncbi:MAG: hypothetical protein ACP5QT_03310 [Brevinematia bacterium]
MKLYRITLLLMVILALNLFGGTGKERKNYLPPIDMIGTGGAGVASYGKTGMIFMKPASVGITPDYWKIIILDMGFSFNNDMVKLANILSRIMEESKSGQSEDTFSDIPWEEVVKLKANFGITGPISMGYIGQGFTFYLYDSLQTAFGLVPYVGMPYIDALVFWDIGLVAGYSRKLPEEWMGFAEPVGIDEISLGFLIKWIHRIKFQDERLNFLSAADTFMAMMQGSTNKGIDYANAFGLDLGTLIKWNEIGIGDMALGIALKDLFLPFSWNRYNLEFQKMKSLDTNTAFSPSFDIGVSYVFTENYVEGIWNFIFYKPAFYFDIVNCFDFSESFFNKLRLGAETKLFKFLALRLGLNKGYFAWGLGIDIPVLKVDFAYYTEEFGSYPGSNPQEIYVINIGLRIL